MNHVPSSSYVLIHVRYLISLQDKQQLSEPSMLQAGDVVDISVKASDNDLGLLFGLAAPQHAISLAKKHDSQWAAAWAKVTEHQAVRRNHTAASYPLHLSPHTSKKNKEINFLLQHSLRKLLTPPVAALKICLRKSKKRSSKIQSYSTKCSWFLKRWPLMPRLSPQSWTESSSTRKMQQPTPQLTALASDTSSCNYVSHS